MLQKAVTAAARIVAPYLVVGILWIYVSDNALLLVVGGDVAELGRLQTFKGWLFVTITTVIITKRITIGLCTIIVRLVTVHGIATAPTAIIKVMIVATIVIVIITNLVTVVIIIFYECSPSPSWSTSSAY